MQFHRNKLAKPIIVFMAATCVYAPTYAQTVKTPMGELRIGMSEDQASSILHASIEDIGGVNMLRQRRISAKVGGQIFAAAVSISSIWCLLRNFSQRLRWAGKLPNEWFSNTTKTLALRQLSLTMTGMGLSTRAGLS